MLLRNMYRMGIDPWRIDAVVISHDHADHTGGLARLLETNPDLEIYIPASSGAGLKGTARSRGSAVFEVSGARAVCGGTSTTGEVGTSIKEQALVVESCAGTLLVTGCAHPGIAEMIKAARSNTAGTVRRVMGGFHLGSSSAADIERIIAELKVLGVRHVGPCHCTGERAIQAFVNAFGDGFLQVGVGKRVEAQELE